MRKMIIAVLNVLLLFAAPGVLAETYYAAANGDDGNPGTRGEPFRTIDKGASALYAGDTLYVRAGLYAEALNNYYSTFRSGSSWDSAITIAGYPGETVTMRPDSGASEVLRLMGVYYLIFENIVMDGIHTDGNVVKITYMGSDPANTARHIRIKNCELMNSTGMGILGSGDSCEFLDLKIHDNGLTDFDHGIYYASTGTIIDGCEIYRNAGWGVHIYSGYANASSHYNMIARNNRIHDNARVGARGCGIILGAGTGHMAYNNVIWGNATGIAVAYGGATDIKVYNNTIFGNLGDGITVAYATNTIIKNNIVYQNGGSAISDLTGAEAVGTVAENNLTTDPKFVNTDSLDFHLLSGSPAIGAGVDLSSIFDTDFDGVARGASWDVGAYEYVESASIAKVPVAPNNLGLDVSPNPAMGCVRFRFGVPAAAKVELRVYDVGGRMVRELVSGRVTAGTRTLAWQGGKEGLRTGMYLARLTVEGTTAAKRFAVMR